MNQPLALFRNLRRPKILIRAARIAATGYRRERDLTRVLKTRRPACPERGLDTLLQIEAELEETRKTGTSAYNVTRHVEVLTAVIAEARLLQKLRAV